MKIRCKECLDVIVSSFRKPFVECQCHSVFIDGSYDKDGKQLLSRYGHIKEDAQYEIRE